MHITKSAKDVAGAAPTSGVTALESKLNGSTILPAFLCLDSQNENDDGMFYLIVVQILVGEGTDLPLPLGSFANDIYTSKRQGTTFAGRRL